MRLHSTRSATEDVSTPDSNGNVVRRFVDEVINSGNYSALQELVHSDYVYRSPEQELEAC